MRANRKQQPEAAGKGENHVSEENSSGYSLSAGIWA